MDPSQGVSTTIPRLRGLRSLLIHFADVQSASSEVELPDMTLCATCGKHLSVFARSTLCDACAQAKRHAEDQAARSAISAFAAALARFRGHGVTFTKGPPPEAAELFRTLMMASIAGARGRAQDVARTALAEEFAVYQALPRAPGGDLGAAEWPAVSRLMAMNAELGWSDDALAGRIKTTTDTWRIGLAGNLPKPISGPIPVRLMPGETAYYIVEATRFEPYEPTAAHGTYGGGVLWGDRGALRAGGWSSETGIAVARRREADTGSLVVTSGRIVFLGRTSSRETRLRALLSAAAEDETTLVVRVGELSPEIYALSEPRAPYVEGLVAAIDREQRHAEFNAGLRGLSGAQARDFVTGTASVDALDLISVLSIRGAYAFHTSALPWPPDRRPPFRTDQEPELSQLIDEARRQRADQELEWMLNLTNELHLNVAAAKGLIDEVLARDDGAQHPVTPDVDEGQKEAETPTSTASDSEGTTGDGRAPASKPDGPMVELALLEGERRSAQHTAEVEQLRPAWAERALPLVRRLQAMGVSLLYIDALGAVDFAPWYAAHLAGDDFERYCVALGRDASGSAEYKVYGTPERYEKFRGALRSTHGAAGDVVDELAAVCLDDPWSLVYDSDSDIRDEATRLTGIGSNLQRVRLRLGLAPLARRQAT